MVAELVELPLQMLHALTMCRAAPFPPPFLPAAEVLEVCGLLVRARNVVACRNCASVAAACTCCQYAAQIVQRGSRWIIHAAPGSAQDHSSADASGMSGGMSGRTTGMAGKGVGLGGGGAWAGYPYAGGNAPIGTILYLGSGIPCGMYWWGGWLKAVGDGNVAGPAWPPIVAVYWEGAGPDAPICAYGAP